MRIGSVVLVTVTVLLAACSQKAPASSSSGATAGAPAPGADKSAVPAGSAAVAEKSAAPVGFAAAADKSAVPAGSASGGSAPGSTQPAAEAPVPNKSPAAGKEPAPEPAKFHELTIPVGTVLTARLSTAIASDTSKIEDAVRGTLTKPLTVSGETAVPAGAEIVGSVLDAKPSGRVKGRASIAFRFSRLNVGTEAHQIHAAQIAREAPPDRKGDVTKGAIGGGVGAVVGGLVGGGKGAVIGAGVGGTGAVLATRGKEMRLPAGTVVSTHLEQPLVVLVPGASK